MGGTVAGIGVLFIGMGMMSNAMVPLCDSQTFIHMVIKFSNPLLGILVGAILIAIIRSSSAFVDTLQALVMDGVINPHNAVFVFFSQNTGTCTMALLASMGTSRNVRRITLIHLISNVIGTAFFVILCILTPSTDFVAGLTPDDPVTRTANVHIIFNISTTPILLPFGSILEKIAIALLPDKQVLVKDTDRWSEDLMASKHHLGASTITVSQIHDEITQMLDTVVVNVSESFMVVASGPGNDGIHPIGEREEEIDLSDARTSKKISRVLVLDQTPKNVGTLNRMYTILGNIERIGDHVMNLTEYIKIIEQRGLSLSGYAQKELKTMGETCREGVGILRRAADGDPRFKLFMAEETEQRINGITLKLRQNQVDWMREGNYNVESLILYSETLTDHERISNHVLNIAQAYAAIERSGDRGQTAMAAIASQDRRYKL